MLLATEQSCRFSGILCKFITRLTERGHTIENLKPIFKQAAQLINRRHNLLKNSTADNNNTIFLHRTYHPYGLGRNTIRRVYQQTLEPVLDYKRMVIATARPPDLRDLLTRAHLTLPENITIQSVIDSINNNNT